MTETRIADFCHKNKKNIVLLSILLFSLALIYYASDITLPFLIGALAAYIMAPLYQIIKEKISISNTLLSLFLSLILTVVILTFSISALPMLYDQFFSLYKILKNIDVEKITTDISRFTNINIKEYLPSYIDDLNAIVPSDIFKLSNQVVAGLINSTKLVISVIMTLIIAPITCFFILRDWYTITASIKKICNDSPKLSQSIKNINIVFRGFLRGQSSLALTFIFFYSIALSLLGLNYSLVLGFIAGITSFIPYVGALLSFSLCFMVSMIQFSISKQLFFIVMIFAFGHMLDMFILSPKLVGKRIGLHPLITIFSLLISAKFFGIIGMFIAMPVTVLLKMALYQLLNMAKQ